MNPALCKSAVRSTDLSRYSAFGFPDYSWIERGPSGLLGDEYAHLSTCVIRWHISAPTGLRLGHGSRVPQHALHGGTRVLRATGGETFLRRVLAHPSRQTSNLATSWDGLLIAML